MKPMTSRARLKWLKAELRHSQMMNRRDAKLLKMGIAQAKRIAAGMRAVQAEIQAKKSQAKSTAGHRATK